MILRILSIILFAFATLAAQTPIAVMDFSADGISEAEARTLTERFRMELIKTGQYKVIERAMMAEIIGEQSFQQSGCINTECIVEAGILIGVKQMIGGSIGKIGSIYTIQARIIEVATGEIIKPATYDHKGNIDDLLVTGMQQIVSILISGLPNSSAMDMGSVYLKSDPSGAKIWVDGVNTTKITPAFLENIQSGSHEIYLESSELEKAVSIEVVTDQIVERTLTLEPISYSLKIVSSPFEAEVSIGNKSYGKTPVIINDIIGNQQTITLIKSDYETFSQTIDLKKIKLNEFSFNLEKYATYNFITNPAGCEISINGNSGLSPCYFSLPKGLQSISIKLNDYIYGKLDFTDSIILDPAITISHSFNLYDLLRRGNIEINTLLDTVRLTTALPIHKLDYSGNIDHINTSGNKYVYLLSSTVYIKDIIVGSYEFDVGSDSFESWNSTIEVRSNTLCRINVELIKSVPQLIEPSDHPDYLSFSQYKQRKGYRQLPESELKTKIGFFGVLTGKLYGISENGKATKAGFLACDALLLLPIAAYSKDNSETVRKNRQLVYTFMGISLIAIAVDLKKVYVPLEDNIKSNKERINQLTKEYAVQQNRLAIDINAQIDVINNLRERASTYNDGKKTSVLYLTLE